MRLEKRGNIYSFIGKDCIWQGYYDNTGGMLKYYAINDIIMGLEIFYEDKMFYI